MLADVRSCSSALEACSRALKWQAAVTLFGSCLGSVQPDIILARASAKFGKAFVNTVKTESTIVGCPL